MGEKVIYSARIVGGLDMLRQGFWASLLSNTICCHDYVLWNWSEMECSFIRGKRVSWKEDKTTEVKRVQARMMEWETELKERMNFESMKFCKRMEIEMKMMIK